MSFISQRQIVLVFSVSLTFLFVGAIASAFVVYRNYDSMVNNPDFLQKQLEMVQANGGLRKGPGRPPALVRVATAQEGARAPISRYHGRLLEVQNGTISSEVSGMIRELPVEAGSWIVGGQTLIATIDNTWTDIALELTAQQIKLTKIKLDHETSELHRLEPLTRNSMVSESEYQTQLTKVNELQANLNLATIANREADEKKKRTVIYAPFDGYVVRKVAEVGDLLAPGNPIVEIISSGQIDAMVHVGESIIDRIKVGDSMPIIVDTLNLRVIGKVHTIVPYAPTAARTFPVYVRIDDQNGRLKVGMRVTALITTADPKPGVILPKDAVLDKADGQTVWVVLEQPAEKSDEKNRSTSPATVSYRAEPVPVRILSTAVDLLVVESETEAGAEILRNDTKVVIEGAERLMPNQQVQISEVNPALFENLPVGSGHTEIKPKLRAGDIPENDLEQSPEVLQNIELQENAPSNIPLPPSSGS